MQCDVCYLDFVGDVVPATLPCGHEICIRCLTSVMRSANKKCHMCREDIEHYSVPFRLRTPGSGWNELESLVGRRQSNLSEEPEHFIHSNLHNNVVIVPNTFPSSAAIDELRIRARYFAQRLHEQWKADDPHRKILSVRLFAVSGKFINPRPDESVLQYIEDGLYEGIHLSQDVRRPSEIILFANRLARQLAEGRDILTWFNQASSRGRLTLYIWCTVNGESRNRPGQVSENVSTEVQSVVANYFSGPEFNLASIV